MSQLKGHIIFLSFLHIYIFSFGSSCPKLGEKKQIKKEQKEPQKDTTDDLDKHF